MAIGALLRPQWFEPSHRLASSPQQEIADRAAIESWRALGSARANADARAKLFVDRFEACGGIDCVAVGCVVEQAPAAEIVDDRRSGMNADAGSDERHAPRFPLVAILF